jgi:small redox-active disulfide protein 2
MEADAMQIKILGPGCAKCEKLAERTRTALDNLGLDAEIEKVTDLGQIMAFGVMLTPGLVVDGEVKLAGKLPSVGDLEQLLTGASGG